MRNTGCVLWVAHCGKGFVVFVWAKLWFDARQVASIVSKVEPGKVEAVIYAEGEAAVSYNYDGVWALVGGRVAVGEVREGRWSEAESEARTKLRRRGRRKTAAR